MRTAVDESGNREPVNRRNFIGASVGAAAAGLAAQTSRAQDAEGAPSKSTAAATAGSAPPPPPRIKLGNTGIEMTRLGQGTGVHGGNRQSDQTRMGFEKLVALFKHAYDRGIRFYDLADLYGTHMYFREALRTIPREEVSILTKIWWRYDGPEKNTSSPHRAQDCRSTLERFRHELNTDYIDIVLLHCMTEGDWRGNMLPYLDVLDEEKEAGRVRAIGCSCHTLEALKAAAAEPRLDVMLSRINPEGVKMDAPTDEVVPVLTEAKESGKAIIGMKIFGEGQLADERDRCMKFAQQLGLLDAMTIGFEEPEQIDDVLRLMAKYPAVGQA